MTDSNLYRHMAALADWRRQHAAQLPRFIWMDAPVQVWRCRALRLAIAMIDRCI